MEHGFTNRHPHSGSIIDIAHLVALIEEARTHTEAALDDLISKLEAASSCEADFDFGGLIKAAQRLLQMDDADMAETLNVSRPTIGRWVRGVSSPHPLGRRATFDALSKKARAMVKLYRAR